jgi:hypothetical protein
MSAILHSTEGAEERFERAIQWLRDNYQDHNIASLCDGLLIAYGYSSPSGWQPIETAPKDQDVLLYCKARGVVRGRWEDCYFARKPRPYWTNDREALFGVSGTRNDQPTHWMPLPPAPNQGEAS